MKHNDISKEDVLAMFSKKEREIVSLLISEAQSRIHADYEKAHSQYRAFLLHLETNLTDFELNIDRARGIAKLTGVNTYATDFFRITGMRPRDYLEYHRMNLAQEIVRHTQADIYTVAFAVGIEDQSLFSRNYKKVKGYPPSKESKAGLGETLTFLEQLKAKAEARQHKVTDPRVSKNTAEINLEPFSNGMVEFWGEVEHMGHTDMKLYLFGRKDTITVGHFYLLLEKARCASRTRIGRGEELADAALDALRLVEFWSGKDHPAEKAIGYANLANICKLRIDYDEADRYFEKADQVLFGQPDKQSLLFAQVKFFKISLMWWRGNAEGAIKMFNEILPAVREYGKDEFLARVLQLGGEIYDYSGHPKRALPLFLEAVEHARFIDDVNVVFSAHHNLTYLYVRLSLGKEAEAQLREVKKLQGSVKGQWQSFFVCYLEGAVARINGNLNKAKSFLLESVQGFASVGLEIYAALASLELALLYLDLDKPHEAFSTAQSVIPSVSCHCRHQEAIAALGVLQEAAKLQNIDRLTVRKALHHLDSVRKDPTSNFLS